MAKEYEIDDSFPMLMALCVKQMRETLNASFCKAGCHVSSEQWMLLVCLSKQDGVSQQTLAKQCGITKVSALNLIKKLEVNSLIVRYPDPIDARSNRVYLTSEGRKLQHFLTPLAKKNTCNISKGIDKTDIEQLKKLLKKILKNLNLMS